MPSTSTSSADNNSRKSSTGRSTKNCDDDGVVGRIHSIQTLGGLDGPGIRCVVFFQGCPMRCLYCHNPDTWNPRLGQAIDSRRLAGMIYRYRNYFGKSGGLTLSGGEPLMQAKFAADLLRMCKGFGKSVHTALDTCGFYWNADVELAMKYTDLVLLDIKHADAKLHKKLVGVEPKPTLDFLRRCNEMKKTTWVRQVIVPGWNDTVADMDALAALLEGKSCIQRIELLAYHTMAVEKWRKLGKKYKLEGVPAPTDKKMAELRAAISTHFPGIVVM